ncbi:hypothetical protein ACLO9Z_24570 [Escherichia coli]
MVTSNPGIQHSGKYQDLRYRYLWLPFSNSQLQRYCAQYRSKVHHFVRMSSSPRIISHSKENWRFPCQCYYRLHSDLHSASQHRQSYYHSEARLPDLILSFQPEL